MPDATELPPCVGERLRDSMAAILFAAYEVTWEAAHPPFEEDSKDDQETQ